jgi:hypothetical protein
MRVTLLNQINEFNFDYATFNYGNGQMVIELTDIYVEQKDGGRKKLVVGQPQEYPDDFNVTGGYNIYISGYTEYTFSFDIYDCPLQLSGDFKVFGDYLIRELKQFNHVGIDLAKDAVMIEEDATNDIKETMNDNGSVIARKIYETLSKAIKIEE